MTYSCFPRNRGRRLGDGCTRHSSMGIRCCSERRGIGPVPARKPTTAAAAQATLVFRASSVSSDLLCDVLCKNHPRNEFPLYFIILSESKLKNIGVVSNYCRSMRNREET